MVDNCVMWNVLLDLAVEFRDMLYQIMFKKSIKS